MTADEINIISRIDGSVRIVIWNKTQGEQRLIVNRKTAAKLWRKIKEATNDSR